MNSAIVRAMSVATHPSSLGVPLEGIELNAGQLQFIAASRAANTVRGDRSHWRDFTSWCLAQGLDPLPATPDSISKYIVELAQLRARVGTIGHRLSTISRRHLVEGLTDPVPHPLVQVVWEGIRRVDGRDVVQSPALVPPDLWDVLQACQEPHNDLERLKEKQRVLRASRDTAVLLVGFVSAMRRSELVAITMEDVVSKDSRGWKIRVGRSKTNQKGERSEKIVLPWAQNTDRCPVTALKRWLALAEIESGPIFRGITRHATVRRNALSSGTVNRIVRSAASLTTLDNRNDYTAHSLRAGFVTHANRLGASAESIATQTRHQSMNTLRGYIREDDEWHNNAATELKW